MRRPWGGARREADGRHEGVWAWSGRTGGRGGSHGSAPAPASPGTRENTDGEHKDRTIPSAKHQYSSRRH